MDSVTLAIATYNRAEWLAESLDSLMAQSRPADQIIVVDDGSTDETASVLSRYGDRLEVMRTDNGGKARAMNLALQHAEGDFTWIFDDDDVAYPDALERLLDMAHARPDAAIIYSSFNFQLREDPPVHRPMPQVAETEVFVRNLTENFLQQQAMLVRTASYREVGPFDESLLRSEDFDMAQRLTRRYRAVGLAGAPTFLYRLRSGHRGVVGAKLEAVERYEVWLHYDTVIIRRLLDDLALWELLPGYDASQDLTKTERRRALLQRICVAARRGLWDLGLADLQRALDADRDSPLQQDEAFIWRRAFDIAYGRRLALATLAADPASTRELVGLLEGPVGQQLRAVFLRELEDAIRHTAEDLFPTPRELLEGLRARVPAT